MSERENGFHATRSHEQLQEMFRNLSKDEQIRLLALIWIRRGRYRSRDWRKAIAAASVDYDKRAIAGFGPARLGE